MAFKFEIIDTALVVTNTVTGLVVLDIPKRDCYYYNPILLSDNLIKITDTNAASAKGSQRFGCDLSDAIDLNSITFTESTWIEFARIHLGRSDVSDYLKEVASGNIPNESIYYKYGATTDVDRADPSTDIWGLSGDYTGFNVTVGDTISVYCFGTGAANNTGLVLSSSVATGGDKTKIQDSGANFIADGVAIGDLIINDTKGIHGVVIGVAATSLLVLRMNDGSANALGDSYRIATATGTGAAVVKIRKALEADRDGYKNEYIVLDGVNTVNTIGSDYVRCSRGQVIISGSFGGLEGGVLAHNTTIISDIFWSLDEGRDQTLVACDTVPKGYTLYIDRGKCAIARVNGSAGSAEVEFKVRDYGETFVSKIHQHISDSNSFNLDTVAVINEYADFKWRVAEVSDDNTQIAATISGVLVKNT